MIKIRKHLTTKIQTCFLKLLSVSYIEIGDVLILHNVALRVWSIRFNKTNGSLCEFVHVDHGNDVRIHFADALQWDRLSLWDISRSRDHPRSQAHSASILPIVLLHALFRPLLSVEIRWNHYLLHDPWNRVVIGEGTRLSSQKWNPFSFSFPFSCCWYLNDPWSPRRHIHEARHILLFGESARIDVGIAIYLPHHRPLPMEAADTRDDATNLAIEIRTHWLYFQGIAFAPLYSLSPSRGGQPRRPSARTRNGNHIEPV